MKNFNFILKGSNGEWFVKVASGKFTAKNDFHTIKGNVNGEDLGLYYIEDGEEIIKDFNNQDGVIEDITLFIEKELEEKRWLMYEWVKEAGDVDWNKCKDRYNF
jgi:hypothetical protein